MAQHLGVPHDRLLQYRDITWPPTQTLESQDQTMLDETSRRSAYIPVRNNSLTGSDDTCAGSSSSLTGMRRIDVNSLFGKRTLETSAEKATEPNLIIPSPERIPVPLTPGTREKHLKSKPKYKADESSGQKQRKKELSHAAKAKSQSDHSDNSQSSSTCTLGTQTFQTVTLDQAICGLTSTNAQEAFRTVVGIDCEWKAEMYLKNTTGASILQVRRC